MTESNPAEIACTHCGKTYRFDAKYRGRKVKCKKCGQAFAYDLPDAQPDAREDTYELADEAQDSVDASTPSVRDTSPPSATSDTNKAVSKCPDCNNPMSRKAVICINCGFDTRSGEKIETQRS